MSHQQLRKVPRRCLRAAAAVAVVVGLLPTVGIDKAGATTGGEELTVSGEFSATGTFESTAECPAFHTIHTGEGSWTGLGDVTFVLDHCVVLGSGTTSPLSGTATVTATDGTLTATVAGSVAGTGDPEGYPADYTTTITAGTGAYQGATGTLELTGVWDDPAIPVYSMHGTVSGTIDLPPPALPHPSSIRGCLHGGWRPHADDDGEPFDDLWGCIIYVTTHRP